ncbi:MAG: thioredoxin family protein [Archaeoglobaceae archaeon]|nr:thioredoxin family protein [Archaeoglobaceae archaeon]
MRNLYIIILLIFVASVILIFISEDEMSGWSSYEVALEESRKSGKEMFIFISSPFCPICKDFKDFLKTREFYEFISSKYVPVYIPNPSKSPFFVDSVPKFCIGYENNLSCFHTSSREKLVDLIKSR